LATALTAVELGVMLKSLWQDKKGEKRWRQAGGREGSAPYQMPPTIASQPASRQSRRDIILTPYPK